MRIHSQLSLPPIQNTPSSLRAEPSASGRVLSLDASTFEPAAVRVRTQPPDPSPGSTSSSAASGVWAQLIAALQSLLARLLGQAPGGAPSTSPASAPGGTSPVSGAGGLAPTPVVPNPPDENRIENTIQNPHIAPRSQFRDAVNQAIDAVRAKGIGVDPQDPDTVTNFTAYRGAVVQELRARGYNAAMNGDELAVGRAGDNFNEDYRIDTSFGKVRRFYIAHTSPPEWA